MRGVMAYTQQPITIIALLEFRLEKIMKKSLPKA